MGMDMSQPAGPKDVQHAFKDAYPDTFSPSQTVACEATDALSRNCSNQDEWKKLQPATQTNGTLF